MKLLSVVVSLACLALGSSPLLASHHRGVDAWADISASGTVTLTATTRWAKGTIGSPESSGVDSNRFGLTTFDCPQTGSVVTLVPATGMRIVRVSDAAVMYTWPTGSFSLSGTTVAVDTSNPAYDERVQQLVIPFGALAPPNAIVAPLNLSHGDFDIIWNDWARVDGIRNLPPNPNCQSLDSGFGFRSRIHWDGAIHHGPRFEPPFGAAIVRGLDYSHNLNVQDDDGGPLTYTLVPTNPHLPDFGPLTQIPGLVLTPAGELTIPAASTIGLLDNSQGVPRADYLLRVRVADSTGMVSELDTLLDVVPSGSGAVPASMTVSRDAGGALTLAWSPSCATQDTDYEIYAGQLGNFTSHAPLFCTTSGTTSRTFAASPGSSYYLVVPATRTLEGSYGKKSGGLERAPAVAACLSQQIASCN